MTTALKGVIIRHPTGKHDTRRKIPVKQIPDRVVLLLNEGKFLESKGQMIHHDTVFYLDKMHDWDYDEKTKTIRVYGTIDLEDPPPILIAYKVKA